MDQITLEETKVLSKYIFEISGIHLEQDKGYLLETRLKPVLKHRGCATYSELYYKARSDRSGDLKRQIIEAISTNETFFFRDNTPFELLRHKIIPDLIDQRSQGHRASAPIPLRIWSAACSTGQEVYSIGMTLHEMLPGLSGYDITILGTDISDQVVAQASYGKYNQFEIERGLSAQYRQKYFTRSGDGWRIKDEIRVLAQFKKINLMQPFADLGEKFDVIFCRNVAIYFSLPDKIKLFQKISKVLKDDGALIVGGSETLSGIAPDFTVRRYLRGIYYQLKVQAESDSATARAPQESVAFKPVRQRPHPAYHAPQAPGPTPLAERTGASDPGRDSSLQPPFRGPALPSHPAASAPRREFREPEAEEPRQAAGPLRQDQAALPPSSPAQKASFLGNVSGIATSGKKSLLASLHTEKSASPKPGAIRPDAEEKPKSSLLAQLAQKKKERS